MEIDKMEYDGSKPLSANKQEAFAQHFAVSGVASKAYREAYPASLKWTQESVWVSACKLSKSPKVQLRVQFLKSRLLEKFEIDARELLLEQYRLATSRVRDLVDPITGKLIPLEELPDNIAAAVASMKVSKIKLRFNGEDGQPDEMEEVIEYKLWNKNTALDSLFKNKGLYLEDNSQRVEDLSPEERQARIAFLLKKKDSLKGGPNAHD